MTTKCTTLGSIEDIGSKTAFLVGAGRSGTTLLYKLLCLHPKAAYISNYDKSVKWLPVGWMARLIASQPDAKLKAWFNRGGNAYFINRPWINKLFPTPVEGESIYKSCGLPLTPEPGYRPDATTCACLRDKFKHIRRASSADIMISKRTANNRRISALETIFPSAKYVYLIRDGRDVTHSLSKVEWWDEHVLWWSGRTAAQMEQSGEERLVVCAKNWVHEMRELQEGLSSIEKERVLEVRYEQLLTDPIGQLTSILDFLGLTMTTEFRYNIESLKLECRPETWPKAWSPDQIARVMNEQQLLLSELGYL